MSVSAETAPMSQVRRYWRDRHAVDDGCGCFRHPDRAHAAVVNLAGRHLRRALAVRGGMGDGLARLRTAAETADLLSAAGAGRSGALSARSGRTRHGGAQLNAISPTLKLLVLPVLIYHFERSSRGMWVFIAFLVSCTLLMLMSCLVAIDPSLSLKAPGEPGGGRGIFVKNYIAQSQEFALCAVALTYPIISLLRSNRIWQAAGAGRGRARIPRQHGVRDRFADSDGDDADHGRGVCAASPEAADQPDPRWRDDRTGRASSGLPRLTYGGARSAC